MWLHLLSSLHYTKRHKLSLSVIRTCIFSLNIQKNLSSSSFDSNKEHSVKKKQKKGCMLNGIQYCWDLTVVPCVTWWTVFSGLVLPVMNLQLQYHIQACSFCCQLWQAPQALSATLWHQTWQCLQFAGCCEYQPLALPIWSFATCASAALKHFTS